MTPAGLLHSEIHGSMPTYGSPWLIAVSRVLLRLLVPRHSPCALCSLTLESLWFFGFLLDDNTIVVLGLPFNFIVLPQYLIAFFVQFSRCDRCFLKSSLVGSSGLEPPTSRLSGVRSNHLSYEPI